MNNWGRHIRLSLFGESHGPAIGIVIDGMPPGLAIDMEFINAQMARRAPGRNPWSTPRKEVDQVRILSGMKDGYATGSPLCAVIQNTSHRSTDYDAIKNTPRPGHADWPAFVKYGGCADMRGGGHFSGRLTAPLLFAGALAMQMIAKHGITIGSHIRRIYDIEDTVFDQAGVDAAMLAKLSQSPFPVLDEPVSGRMLGTIMNAREAGGFGGGHRRDRRRGCPGGTGEPLLRIHGEPDRRGLSIPSPPSSRSPSAQGLSLSEMRGSDANDPYHMDHGRIRTATNHNGGILGGITTGMPIVLADRHQAHPLHRHWNSGRWT